DGGAQAAFALMFAAFRRDPGDVDHEPVVALGRAGRRASLVRPCFRVFDPVMADIDVEVARRAHLVAEKESARLAALDGNVPACVDVHQPRHEAFDSIGSGERLHVGASLPGLLPQQLVGPCACVPAHLFLPSPLAAYVYGSTVFSTPSAAAV